MAHNVRPGGDSATVAAAQQAGYLVNPVQPDTIRLAPPLVVESGQIQRWLHDFPAILDTQEVTS